MPEPKVLYYCSPADWGENSGWILFRETVYPISGNSGWTTKPASKDLEKLACRKNGDQYWKKWDPEYSGAVTLNYKREEVAEPEAIGILLMTKK